MRDVPAQGESCLACSPLAIQGELKLGSSNDLPLVKDPVAGDHLHAAPLPSRESSKKAHLSCHIYGIKWLARSQITYNGRGMHETPCTHNFHCVALLFCGFPRGLVKGVECIRHTAYSDLCSQSYFIAGKPRQRSLWALTVRGHH